VSHGRGKHLRHPDFIDAASQDGENGREALLEQLQGREVQSLNRNIALADVARLACERTRVRKPEPTTRLNGPDVAVQADPERLVMMAEHLIRNAQDACEADGSVTVTVDAGEQWAEIAVEDDGCGMDATFIRERLFRPFDTTKRGKVRVWGVPNLGLRHEPGRIEVQASRSGYAHCAAIAQPVADAADLNPFHNMRA
jgi:signal transduction histidine kinase